MEPSWELIPSGLIFHSIANGRFVCVAIPHGPMLTAPDFTGPQLLALSECRLIFVHTLSLTGSKSSVNADKCRHLVQFTLEDRPGVKVLASGVDVHSMKTNIQIEAQVAKVVGLVSGWNLQDLTRREIRLVFQMLRNIASE